MSPQNINSDFGLYRHFKVASSHLRNSLTSPEGALYTFNIIRKHNVSKNWICFCPQVKVGKKTPTQLGPLDCDCALKNLWL
jgi:hypothetical protein